MFGNDGNIANSLSKKDFSVTVLTNKNQSINLTEKYSVVQKGCLESQKIIICELFLRLVGL